MKKCLTITGLVLLSGAALVIGQERPRTVESVAQPDEVLRVNTRVVFIDTMVKDHRTGEPIDNLTREDFDVIDNGKPRPITYFSRERTADHRPLALLIVLAPLDDGAANSLRTPEVVNSLATALAKLPPGDEVALMLVWRYGGSRMLVDLTRDRATITSALASLPKLDKKAKSELRAPAVIQNASLAIARQRPQSQTRVVVITDSVFLVNDSQRDEMVRKLIGANVTFNALVTGTDPFFAAFSPILRPAQERGGVSWYDVPQYWSQQTGGEHVRVHKTKDYGPALEKLVGNLAARYSLGFTLPEGEADDGQMHRLDVRVTARDANGKPRNVEVSARTGYYAPHE